jgi:hypothetical protein
MRLGSVWVNGARMPLKSDPRNRPGRTAYAAGRPLGINSPVLTLPGELPVWREVHLRDTRFRAAWPLDQRESARETRGKRAGSGDGHRPGARRMVTGEQSGPVAQTPLRLIRRRGAGPSTPGAHVICTLGSRAGCRAAPERSGTDRPATRAPGHGRRPRPGSRSPVSPQANRAPESRSGGGPARTPGARMSAGGEQIRGGLLPPDHRSVDSRRLVAVSDARCTVSAIAKRIPASPVSSPGTNPTIRTRGFGYRRSAAPASATHERKAKERDAEAPLCFAER